MAADDIKSEQKVASTAERVETTRRDFRSRITNSKGDDTTSTKSKHLVQFIMASDNASKPSTTVVAFLPEEISLDIQSRYATPFGEGLLPMDSFVTKAMRTFGISGVSREMSLKVWEGTDGITVSLPLTFTVMDMHAGRKFSTNIVDQILELVAMCAPSKKSGNIFLDPPGPTVVFNTDKVVDVMYTKDSLVTSNESGEQAAQTTNDSETQTVEVEKPTSGTSKAMKVVTEGKEKLVRLVQSITESILAFDTKVSVYLGDFLYFDNVVIDSVSQQYSTIFDKKGQPLYATVNVQFTTMFAPTIEDIREIFKRNLTKDKVTSAQPATGQPSEEKQDPTNKGENEGEQPAYNAEPSVTHGEPVAAEAVDWEE